MCGIAGWNLTEIPDSSFYLSLAAIMQERGLDSCGMLNGDTSAVIRRVGAITETIRASEMACKQGFLHTRAATTGLVTAENCHPFDIGHLTGAHNGVIYNHARLKRNCAVDSMHIFHAIAENTSLLELEGYGAIEYFDHDTKQWLIGSCNHGALEVAKTNIGVVWASTDDAIRTAIFQAGLTLEHFYKIVQGELYEVRADGLYSAERTFQLGEKPKDALDWRELSKPGSARFQQENWHLFGNSDAGGVTDEPLAGDCEWCGDPCPDLLECNVEGITAFVCEECLPDVRAFYDMSTVGGD